MAVRFLLHFPFRGVSSATSPHYRRTPCPAQSGLSSPGRTPERLPAAATNAQYNPHDKFINLYHPHLPAKSRNITPKNAAAFENPPD